MTKTVRRVAVAVSALAVLAGPGQAVAQTDPERELVRRYAPIVMVKVNPDPPCSRGGEQYRPSPVTITLGNPEVRLVRPRGGGIYKERQVLATAPEPSDLARLGSGYYLDLPGHPRSPGCLYARTSARLLEGVESVTYAHIAREPGVRGIALQFWFYYWFNQFNDLHESDWEMIQIAFDAATVEEALARGPSELAYAQHEGGERRSWDDPRVEKEETHPVVYISSGSHASQYWSALFLGNGRRGSGLGCDDTRGPSTRVAPRPILVPTFPDPSSDQAWLTYSGHWGQREPGVSNGPTGPNMKLQWLQPFRWMSSVRTSTPTVPSGGPLGDPVTGFFCGAISFASSILNATATNPLAFLAVFLVIALLLVFLAWRTTWRPIVVTPLRLRRAGGQIVDAAARLYWEHAGALLVTGLLAVPLGSLAVGAQALLFHSTGLRRAFDDIGDDKVEGFVALVVGGLTHGLAPILTGAAVVILFREVEQGRKPRLRAALGALRGEFWRLVGLGLAGVLAVFLLMVTVIGIPYAIKKAVDWSLVQQTAGFEGARGLGAYHGSRTLVRGHWRRVASITFLLLVVLAVTGPFVGIAVVFITDASLSTINFFAALVFAVVLPFVSTALTLLFFDLAARRDTELPTE